MNNNKHTMTKPYLPSVHQTWAHSVCDRHTLANILSEQKVTAIETDILMGSFVDHDEIPVANVNFEERIPIMAHPPSRSSNLTPDIFFDMVFRCQDKAPHIKLDFKEIDTVQSVLGSLMDSYSKHCMDDLNLDEKLCVYLNADVLAGPGMQNESAKVDAEDFMNICSDIILKYQTSNLVWAFSLGWRTDPRAYGNGYEDNHVDEMLDLIKKHSKVTENVGMLFKMINHRQSTNSIMKSYSFRRYRSCSKCSSINERVWTYKKIYGKCKWITDVSMDRYG